jgi:acyl-coenzyme A thioesterase PaaI-like protein
MHLPDPLSGGWGCAFVDRYIRGKMKLQASAKSCFVCGVENAAGLQMRFFEGEGEPVIVTAEYTVSRQYQGYPGIVHGGIVAAMLDEVTSRTIMRGDPPRFVVTAKLSLRYRKPVPVETPLKMTGRVIEDRGKVIMVSGVMVGPDGELLAEAEAVLMEVPANYFGAMTVEDGQSWRVYDDLNNNTADTSPGGAE